jgi:hypothetical protein
MLSLYAYRYHLRGLKPSTGYEVRVSHPASVSSTWLLSQPLYAAANCDWALLL